MHKGLIAQVVFALLGLFFVTAVGAASASAQSATGTAGSQEQPVPANQLVQERQAAYQVQFEKLNQRIQTAAAVAGGLESQAQVLKQQLAELQRARGERTAIYKTQMDAMQAEYTARIAQYAAQLQEAQARLAEANAQLGR